MTTRQFSDVGCFLEGTYAVYCLFGTNALDIPDCPKVDGSLGEPGDYDPNALSGKCCPWRDFLRIFSTTLKLASTKRTI